MINFCFMVKRSFLLLTTIVECSFRFKMIYIHGQFYTPVIGVECSFRFKMIYIFYISIRAQRSWMYLSLLDDLHRKGRQHPTLGRWMYPSFLDDLHHND